MFFLPVIGVPVAGCGLVICLAGVLLTCVRRGVGLRWGLAGLAVCVIALGINLALYRAPYADLGTDQPPRWNPLAARAVVPPPAPE